VPPLGVVEPEVPLQSMAGGDAVGVVP